MSGSLYDCDIYSGISSGSILSTILVHKMPLEESIRAALGESSRLPNFSSRAIYDLAGADIVKRLTRQTFRWFPSDKDASWTEKLLQVIPTGIFKGQKLQAAFAEAIKSYGGDDTFTNLKTELYIGATDQDSFSHVVFGEKPWHNVAISDAVRASCALPPVFTPWKIKDKLFLDGQITRSCNIDLLAKKVVI